MTVLSLVFDAAKNVLGSATGKGPSPKTGVGKTAIGIIELDLAISENHNFKSDVTTLPVEGGGNMSDHIINQPFQLTIEGFITNSPLEIFGSSIGTVAGSFLGDLASDIFGDVASTVGGVIGGLVGDAIAPKPDYVQLAFQQMMKLRESKTPITIVTGLDIYQKMVMTSLTIPRDISIGDAIKFTADFVQVSTANAETVTIPNETIADQATPNKDAGRQTTSEITPEVEEKSSLLYKLVK